MTARIDELAQWIRQVNADNGWNVTESSDWNAQYKIPAVLALIHSEVSEALEAFREQDINNFKEEMADIVIRVLDCVAAFESNFHKVLCDKIEYNRTREFRHGGKML